MQFKGTRKTVNLRQHFFINKAKEKQGTHQGALFLFILSNEFYSNPFGFLFCQFQLSRTISLIPYSARQQSSRSAFEGSE